jgi:hypothetical protein
MELGKGELSQGGLGQGGFDQGELAQGGVFRGMVSCYLGCPTSGLICRRLLGRVEVETAGAVAHKTVLIGTEKLLVCRSTKTQKHLPGPR